MTCERLGASGRAGAKIMSHGIEFAAAAEARHPGCCARHPLPVGEDCAPGFFIEHADDFRRLRRRCAVDARRLCAGLASRRAARRSHRENLGDASRRRLSLLRFGATAPADCGRDSRDTCDRKNGPTGISTSSPLGRACSAPLSRNRATNAPSTPRSPICQSRSPASAVRIAAAAPRICDSGRKARRFLPGGKMLGRRPRFP